MAPWHSKTCMWSCLERSSIYLFFLMPYYCCLWSMCSSICLSLGISPISFSLPGSTSLSVPSRFFLPLPFLFTTSVLSFVTIDFLVVYGPELIDLSTLVLKIRKKTSLPFCCLLARLSLIPLKLI